MLSEVETLCRVKWHENHQQHPKLIFLYWVDGIWQAIWNCDGAWWVSCKHWLLRCCRSKVILGCQSFFAVATIVEHHWTGVPIETSCGIPFLTWLSNSSLTSCLQWNGTSISVCLAYGTAFDFKWIWAGGTDMLGNSDDLLKVMKKS